ELTPWSTHFPYTTLFRSDLLEEEGQVVGVRAKTPDGPFEVRADLTVGADGRSSIVRDQAELKVNEFGAPMDVLWFRLSRRPDDRSEEHTSELQSRFELVC